MSKIITKTVQVTKRRSMKVMLESYASAMDVVKDCRERGITNPHFKDQSKRTFGDWEGVESYDEALGYMKDGYQPIVEELKGSAKVSRLGEGKRISFKNDIVGAVPVVPLALCGVPTSMVNMTMKPIKCKVIDVYYDITCPSGTSAQKIIDNGKKLLGAILKLEAQGYRFNLYAMQTYSDRDSTDVLTVKLKSSNQPLDLRRISFPLTHTAFFRVIGFDWYSRTPKGTHRHGYGSALSFNLNDTEMKEFISQMFGKNAMYIAGRQIMDKEEEYIKEVLTTNESKSKN